MKFFAAICLLVLSTSAVNAQMSQGMKDSILAAMNAKRMSLQGTSSAAASGGQPCATNMVPLVWDDGLATIAQTYADKCIWGHNADRTAQNGGSYTGENIAVSTVGSFCTDTDCTSGNKMWWDESADYTYSSNTCASGKVCGHYTQLAWAATTKVGCGYKSCSTMTSGGDAGQWNKAGNFVVCDFNPGGNFNFNSGSAMYSTEGTCPETSPSKDIKGTFELAGVDGSALTDADKTIIKDAIATGLGAVCDAEGCIADKSLGKCEKCLKTEQCEGGSTAYPRPAGSWFCCPYMKRCIQTSSMGCQSPVAQCSPMCFDSKVNSQCTCVTSPVAPTWQKASCGAVQQCVGSQVTLDTSRRTATITYSTTAANDIGGYAGATAINTYISDGSLKTAMTSSSSTTLQATSTVTATASASSIGPAPPPSASSSSGGSGGGGGCGGGCAAAIVLVVLLVVGVCIGVAAWYFLCGPGAKAKAADGDGDGGKANTTNMGTAVGVDGGEAKEEDETTAKV